MNQNKGPLIKFGSPDNFKDVIAVRDVHVLTYNDHNGNVVPLYFVTRWKTLKQ